MSRYDDVSDALADWRTFSSVGSMSCDRSGPGERSRGGGEKLITTDPPYHDGLRRVVREHLSPNAVRGLEETIAREAATRLSSLAFDDTLDVAGDFAWPLALAVVSEIVGIPKSDRPALLSWYQRAEYLDTGDRAANARARYDNYFDELGSERRMRPRGDLMSHLMHAVARGDISRPDAMVLCQDLVEGGLDVPANLIANAVLTLAKHPDQRARLIHGDEAQIRLGVEELARYESPIQSIPRVTATAVSCRDTSIPRGAKVLLMLGSANRDERRFDNPDILDVSRPAMRNLAFGSGVHFCIGAPLARLEARMVLPGLLAALADYEIVPPVERPHSPVMRALLHLNVAVTPDELRLGATGRGR
jgi:cytochrome P450